MWTFHISEHNKLIKDAFNWAVHKNELNSYKLKRRKLMVIKDDFNRTIQNSVEFLQIRPYIKLKRTLFFLFCFFFSFSPKLRRNATAWNFYISKDTKGYSKK